MKGVDGGYTGEKGITLDERARGMGGVQSSCGEENLLDLDTDPRYAGRDILTHEFAHCVMDVGLPPKLQSAIRETYAEAVEAKGRWTRADGSRAYAGSCPQEYWAELTMWYFGTHGEFVDRKEKLPAPGPGGLAAYDPDGFALLASIYGGTHPNLSDPDPPTQRLTPSQAASKSVNEDEEEANLVTVEFDNRGCDCAWKLFWLTPEGERLQYGEVQRDAVFVQTTYAGHVWELEAGGGGARAAAAAYGPLRYRAAKGDPCVAPVSDDSSCRAYVHAAPVG